MLVLSRHRDESIVIGDDIIITVVDLRGDKVRLGIDAPRNTSVHRREVYDAIKKENEAVAKLGHLEISVSNVLVSSIDEEIEGYLDRGEYLKAYDFFLKHQHEIGYDSLQKLTNELGRIVQSHGYMEEKKC